MSHSDTVPLHSSSQSYIDEIETLIQAGPTTVLPDRSSAFINSNLPPRPPQKLPKGPPAPPPVVPVASAYPRPGPVPTLPPIRPAEGIAADGFGSGPNTLTEPVWDTVKWDLARIVSNLKLVVFPQPVPRGPGEGAEGLGSVGGPSSSSSSWVSPSRGLLQSRSWCNYPHIECFAPGWTHYLLSKSQPSWLLPISSGRWSSDLLA